MPRTRLTRLSLAALTAGILLALTGASRAAAASDVMAVCGTAIPGQAHCDAALRVRPGTHDLIRPRVASSGRGRRAHLSTATVAGEPAAGSPQWLQQAYDLTALSASRGSGDTIAIVDAFDDPDADADLATFRSTYGLPACTEASGCLQIVNEQGATSPLPPADSAWAMEETLDLQAVSSICPNCDILLVEASSPSSEDLETAMQSAVELGADQISDSWSVSADTSPFPADFLTPATGGTLPAIFAASGDDGTDPLGEAEFPAALASVTAVGGTTLTASDSASDPRGFTEAAWSESGSGCAVGETPVAGQAATGCPGRAYSDVSADADPDSGLNVYAAAAGGWATAGGTSLATPMVAAFDALTGVDSGSPQWAYADAGALNDPAAGTNGQCVGLLSLLCIAGVGYDGPTGAGSISGAVIPGAPGIAGATFEPDAGPSDVAHLATSTAVLTQGLYANDETTTTFWQYGTTTRYGHQTRSVTVAAGAGPTAVSVDLTGLAADRTYHYRLVAENAGGTADGPDLTFTTPGPAHSASPARTVKPRPAAKRAVKRAAKKAVKPSVKPAVKPRHTTPTRRSPTSRS